MGDQMGDQGIERLILMPRRALRARASRLSAGAARVLEELDGFVGLREALTAAKGVHCRVIDSIRGDGPKLIEIAKGDIPAMRAAYAELDLVPVVYYRQALAPRPTALDVPAVPAGAAAAPAIRVKIIDSTTNRPVAGATIAAFTNFAALDGRNGLSDDDGIAALDFQTSPVEVERLYVYPPLAGYWGHFRRDVALADELTVALRPIDLTWTDSLRYFYSGGGDAAGAGVTVGIVDGGVGPHPHLVCEGDADNGNGHGTHVAGIIAGRGKPPTGVRGLAPGVKLRSYRVFGAVDGLAANFSIAKAIDTAVRDDKCDLINLSINLDGTADDPAVRSALEDARAAGVLPIAAVGNEFRHDVGFPARDPMCIAVSALGRKGTFPADSLELSDVVAPFGRDDNDFIAAFSNVGMEVDVTAPGTGIISAVPGGYGVMSGTSMACPAVTGIAARLLARDQELLTMAHGPERSARLAQLVMGTAASLGFAADLQGAGLLQEQGEV